MGKTYWTTDSEMNKNYVESTWFRCVGIEDFLSKVEEKWIIVGVEAEDNNIGFILNRRKKDDSQSDE